jgi:hypothetical protein
MVIVTVSPDGEGDALGGVEHVFGLKVDIVAVVIAVSQIDAQDAASVFVRFVRLVFIFQELDSIEHIIAVGVSHPIIFEASILPFSAAVEIEGKLFFELTAPKGQTGPPKANLRTSELRPEPISGRCYIRSFRCRRDHRLW